MRTAPPQMQRAIVEVVELDVVDAALGVGGSVRRGRSGRDPRATTRDDLDGLTPRPPHMTKGSARPPERQPAWRYFLTDRAAKTTVMPTAQATAARTRSNVGPPSTRARTALTVAVTGWWSA